MFSWNLLWLAGLILLFSAVAGRVERSWVSGPMLFTGLGLLLGPLHLDPWMLLYSRLIVATAGAARSGCPPRNGGAGSYSNINWMPRAVSGPYTSAATAKAKSMPAQVGPGTRIRTRTTGGWHCDRYPGFQQFFPRNRYRDL